MAPARARCADCGLELSASFPRSCYFARPLCSKCYRAETARTTADAERWVLERMFAGPVVINGDPR